MHICLFSQYTLSSIAAEYSMSNSPRECLHIKYENFSNCVRAHEWKPGNKSKPYSCWSENICRKTFNISAIKLPPFSLLMDIHVKEMVFHCCGDCAEILNGSSFSNMSEVTATSISTSDIIFPIFSRSSVNTLYGFWFIPLIDIPSGYYVTRERSKGQIMKDMLMDILKLWPIICICLLLAVISGFVVWILETWVNKDEFPRPFLIGIFEGVWWSFISMTTVGYGDKAPKSCKARIFSIIWILIGITIFSLITASMTNIITTAETPPSIDMTGKTVGTLKHRVYDATLIAKHGGILYEIEYDNVFSGINKLRDLLFSHLKIIDGFLVDKYTYYYYCFFGDYCEGLKGIILTEVFIETEKLYYGMIVKNSTDYYYFRKYVTDNWFQFDTCHTLITNSMINTLKFNAGIGLFAADSGVFIPFLLCISIVLGVIIIFGVLYEFRRKKGISGKMELATTTSDTHM